MSCLKKNVCQLFNHKKQNNLNYKKYSEKILFESHCRNPPQLYLFRINRLSKYQQQIDHSPSNVRPTYLHTFVVEYKVPRLFTGVFSWFWLCPMNEYFTTQSFLLF